MPGKTKELLRLFNIFGQEMKKQMCMSENELTTNLTVAQVNLLHVLYYHKKMSMADIAKELQIAPASATSLVDRLVKQGWLKRETDEDDRRKVFIEISEDKMPVWQECHMDVLDQLGEYLDVLSEEQKQQFIDILKILTKEV